MRMIIADRDGLTGDFYARTQERADRESDGRVAIGERTDGHVTILAIETGDGTFGWLKGTRPGESARALREAAAVLDEAARHVQGGSYAREVITYLTHQAERLERQHRAMAVSEFSCPFCGRPKGRPCARVEDTYTPELPDLDEPHQNRLALLDEPSPAIRGSFSGTGRPA
jgi:hypothetical protein